MISGLSWDAKNRIRRIITHCSRRIRGKRKDGRIVVSLTSYPARIATVSESIHSLLSQSVLPDVIVLWLCRSDFPHGISDLPGSLRRMLASDIQVRWVNDDLKPHKKYFWALQEYSKDNVIIVDDDLIYRDTMIADLLAMHERHPGCIVASRAHLIMFDAKGQCLPYQQWIYEAPHYYHTLVGKPSMRLFATNGAGTLYPPEVNMPEQTFDADRIRRLCLTADDLWLKAMQVIAGVRVVAATDDELLTYVPGTQGEEALCHQNTENGANDLFQSRILADLHQRGLLSSSFSRLVADSRLDSDLIDCSVDYEQPK